MKPTKRFLPLATSLVVMAAGLLLGSQLQLDNDISSLLPDSSQEMTRTSKALTRLMSRTVVDIAVVPTDSDPVGVSADPVDLGRVADEFADRLTATKLVADVRARMGMEDALPLLTTLRTRAPLLLDESALREIETELRPEQAIPKIQKLARDIQQIDGQHLMAWADKDPLGLTTRVTAPLQALGDTFEPARLIDGRMVSADGAHLLVLVEVAFAPNDTDNNRKFQAAITNIIGDLESESVNANGTARIRIRHFGAHRATMDNVDQIQTDVFRTSSIGVGVVALLAILCFGRFWLALLALMPATFGGLFAIGACSLFKDKMSGAVLGFGAVLLGLTIDFAVHVLFRIDRTDGKQRVELPVRALYMGGVTTSLAFIALLASSLPALRDIGVFGAVGIFSAVMFALYVLPTLVSGKARAKPILDLKKVVEKIARPAMPTMFVALGVTPVIVIGIFFLEFDGNPTNLSALSKESAEDDRAIESVWGQGGQVAALVVEGPDLDSALAANDRLRVWLDSLPEDSFRRHSSISGLLPSLATQRNRWRSWQGFWTDDRLNDLRATLALASAQSPFHDTAFEPFVEWIRQDPEFLTYEEQRDGPMQPLLADRIYEEDGTWRVTTPLFTEGWDQVAALDARLRSEMPGVTLLNRQAFSRKLASMVTGEVGTLGLLAFLLVGTVVFMWHGRILITLAILFPLLMALTWSLGLLGWFGIPISLANAIFVVFLFGVAVDYAIFLASSRLDHFRTGEDRTTEAQASVLLCTLTTCGGFGSLVFAGHPVMHSIGLTALIGILATAITTQVFVPALTMALLRRGGPNGTPGLPNILAGFWVCRTMVVRGLWHLASAGKGDPGGKRRAAADAIHRMSVAIREKFTFGERRYVDEDKLLDEPCIFVANHESMYDIVAALALPRPTQVLAKGWVFRAPIMGRMVRAAGYIRTSDADANQVFAEVTDRIETGHSVLVFPEGKRSRNRRIGRFHNGAFAMARKLGVKVQPIAMVNTREVVPYKAWWIGDHSARVCVLDPMDPKDYSGDDGDRRMARAARDRVRDRCRSLWLDTQFGPRWHSIVGGMYRYLGPMITHYAISKCKRDPLIKELPRLCEGDGRILVAGGGFGLMTSRIALAFPERPVSCLDLDERKLQLARAALGEHYPVDFVVGDLRNMELPSCGLALLIDVLHYWDIETQRAILRRVGSSLPIGGRLLFRDGCATGDSRHNLVFVQELIAVVTGFTRSHGRLLFRSEADWTALLEECGFEIEEARPDLGSFSNVVLICRKCRAITEKISDPPSPAHELDPIENRPG